jgi:predicted DsbA family dithiol-disulfide isomerase
VSAVRINHFSDLLCVWAYAADRRMIELHDEFGDAVEVDYRFVSIFGSAGKKLAERWAEKGGMAAYASHVRGVVTSFGHVEMHADVWSRVTPTSSWPAHLALCAARILERESEVAPGAFVAYTRRLRQAFFAEAQDISRQDVLLSAAEQVGVAPASVARHLASGRAHAELAADHEQARELDVRMSPTLLLNENRMRLSGNVGYRVIAANVREVLEKRVGQVSWC